MPRRRDENYLTGWFLYETNDHRTARARALAYIDATKATPGDKPHDSEQ